jgi:hypothetical protein
MVGAELLMQRWYVPHHYRQLVPQLVIAGAVYAVGLVWLFTSKRIFQVGELVPKEKPIPVENGMGTAAEAYQQDV